MKNVLGYTNQRGCFIETAFATNECIVTNNCTVTDTKFLAKNTGKKFVNCGNKEFQYRLLAFQKGLSVSELDKTESGKNLTNWQND